MPEHHGRRGAGHLGDRGRVPAAAGARGADRDAGARLDGAAGVEHPRRVHRRRARQPGRRLRRVQPARARLQRPGVGDDAARRTARAPAHPAGPPGLGAVPHQLLRAGLGFLPGPGHPGRAAGRRLRGPDRLHPRGRPPHLRRARGPRAGSRRGDRLLPRLPPVAGQRQPGRHRGGDVPGAGAGGTDAVLHVPVPVRARHHRGHHLAGPQRGACGTGQARPGAGLRGRPGPADLQTEQAR